MKLLLLLLAFPMIGFGQAKCISGNCENGQGTETYGTSGNKYVGEFKYGNKHGQGTFIWADGNKYVGQWMNDDMHGQGTFTWRSGNKYVGQYMNDMRHGQGTATYADGTIERGLWENDRFLKINFTPSDETSAVHTCEWCNIKYKEKGYLVDKQYKIEAVGDFMDTKRTSIYASGYHWFCSRKCASEYLLSLD